DFSLVLDSGFPVIVGEKAWNALTVETDLDNRGQAKFSVSYLSAGLAPSIVPDMAKVFLSPEPAYWALVDENGKDIPPHAMDPAGLTSLKDRVRSKPLPVGTSIVLEQHSREDFMDPQDEKGNRSIVPVAHYSDLEVSVKGKAAHAGVNAEGGRNALVALANLVTDELPNGGAKDLLAFVRLAGQDLSGTGLGLTQVDPVFGKATVVPSLLQMEPDGKAKLTINIRTTPALSGEALKAHLFAQVAAFNAKTGAHLVPGGFFGDTPLAFDPQSKLVKRLLAAYERGTGKAEPPAISGGGTYAKRLPRAIAFGMWFPGKPYPGHDVDEKLPIADLHRGVHVLLEALGDLACGPALKEPFKP
ncbi:MAG TPA: hypothetical protein VJ600_04235, partial [Holophagaceae bacterium]|nr:hypothetical protein [Holophagaceae bacterium]